MIMKKFSVIYLLMLATVAVSCSKSDDEIVASIYKDFYSILQITPQDFPEIRTGGLETDQLSKVTRYCDGYKNNTEDYYIWLCDANDKIIGKTVINIPKTIIEDQGYGNIVTCGPVGVSNPEYLLRVNNLEFYSLELSYTNSKNNFSYLLLLNGEKLSAQKYLGRSYFDLHIIEWYNNSVLYCDESGDYYILSDNGNLISVIDKSIGKNSLYLFYNSKIIPLNYYSYTAVANERGSQDRIFIEVNSLDKNDYISFSIQSPFNTTEDFIVNTASLLESTDSYYLLECQLISYSGEKKTVKIKIVPKENSAKIVD